jgi:hypothetical protein
VLGGAAQVFVTDLGKEYGGWPLNDMERSYKFMIRHARLWKVAFHGTSPRWVHGVYLAALAYFYAKYVGALPCQIILWAPRHYCCLASDNANEYTHMQRGGGWDHEVRAGHDHQRAPADAAHPAVGA